MEGELIAIILSSVISGGMLLWKIIKKIRKSKCYIVTEDGDKIGIDFDTLEKVVEKVEEYKLTPEQKEKLKNISAKIMEKKL